MIRVKICGVTNWSDARAACDAGANLLGLNFYEKSPRRVSTAEAAQIRGKLPAGVEAVGVFVNSSPEEIASLRAFVRFNAVQFHGDEGPGMVSQVASTVPVIKAFRVAAGFVISAFDAYPNVFAFLLDAVQAGQYGGTGLTTDWGLARRAAASHRIILAGGLTPENVAAAILLVRPYAVDVASGVESRPGKKDAMKLQEFIREVRRAESQLEALAEESEHA
jgi:phosphoribosylanthranilate isomerase